jgi:hypothetical protein
MRVALQLPANGRGMTTNGPSNGGNAKALCIQIGNLISFRSGEVRISWHGNIAFLCDNKRISNPLAMLHLASEFTALSVCAST